MLELFVSVTAVSQQLHAWHVVGTQEIAPAWMLAGGVGVFPPAHILHWPSLKANLKTQEGVGFFFFFKPL